MPPLRALVRMMLLPYLRWVISALGWLVSGPLAGFQWLREFRVERWIVEGEEQSSHLPLSILCTAEDTASRNYLLQLIFGDSYRQRCLGRCWIWNVAKAPADCSLIFVESDKSRLTFARSDDWFLIPTWVFGQVDLPRDASSNRKVDRDLRRIRQAAFEFEVTRDPRHFDDFYHNMYIPNVTQTYGNCSDIRSYRNLKAIFRRGDLLLIKQREQSIAGQLIDRPKAGPYLFDMGIRDGSRNYLKRGAGAACYHFALQYLQEEGHKHAFLGWSRPFLRDGVLRYKRSWSQRIVDSCGSWFAVRILSHTSAVRAFLSNNPFIFQRRGTYYGAVFVDSDRFPCDEELQEIDKQYYHPGLSRLLVYCLGRNGPPPPNLVSPELSEHIELRCAQDVPGDSASPGSRTRSFASP